VATSTDIHVRIPFNFTQILDTKYTIKQNYNLLLDKHEEPFKTIAKTTTDVNLLTISVCIGNFQDVIKLPKSQHRDDKQFVGIAFAIKP